MKLVKQAPEFTPVVITLESQDEVDQLFAMVNFTDFDIDQDLNRVLYNYLYEECAANRQAYTLSSESSAYIVKGN